MYARLIMDKRYMLIGVKFDGEIHRYTWLTLGAFDFRIRQRSRTKCICVLLSFMIRLLIPSSSVAIKPQYSNHRYKNRTIQPENFRISIHPCIPADFSRRPYASHRKRPKGYQPKGHLFIALALNAAQPTSSHQILVPRDAIYRKPFLRNLFL